MDIWWTLHLARDPASVPIARRLLLGAMETAGVDPQIAFDLGVALTEACANAVEHASSDRPGAGFQVTASIAGDRLRIEVIDSGPGLPPVSTRLPATVPLLRRAAPRSRSTTGCRTRRGRATLPARVLVPHRPQAADRPAPYDTHVVPAGRPTAVRTPDLDALPELDAESGRGLFLIHALADHVQLSNHPLRGAIVSFDKVLKWQADALPRIAS